jgi:hypothetical protein
MVAGQHCNRPDWLPILCHCHEQSHEFRRTPRPKRLHRYKHSAMLAAYSCTSMPRLTKGRQQSVSLLPPDSLQPDTVITGNSNQSYNPDLFPIAPNYLGPGPTNCSPNVGQLGDSGRDILGATS